MALAVDGRIAAGGPLGRLALRAADGTLIRQAQVSEGMIFAIAFQTGGRGLVVATATEVLVVSLPDLGVTQRSGLRLDVSSLPVFRAGGQRVLHIAGRKLVASEVDGGRTVSSCDLPRSFSALHAGDDGPALLGDEEGNVAVIDPATGAVSAAVQLGGSSGLMVTAALVYPGNRLGMIGLTDASIQVLELATGRVVRALKGHTCNVFAFEGSPSGKWLFSGGGTGMLPDEDLYGDPHENSVRAWDLMTGKMDWSLDTGRALPMVIRCAPDGQRLVLGMQNGEVRVVDLPREVV